MSSLITSDIHLTDNPRDAYRWGLLPWIARQAHELKVDNILILGDFTDAKDRHPAELVNRFVHQIRHMASYATVWLLKANHDYIDPNWPFFAFLDDMENVQYITSPASLDLRIGGSLKPVLFLPSVKDPEEWGQRDFRDYDYIFTHQTYDGAKAENGQPLTGFPPSIFAKIPARIYSGDIHVPQKLPHGIEYIGAPYRVHFGDQYTPRVLYIDGKGVDHDLSFPCPNKVLVVIRTLGDLEKASRTIKARDQVKVRVRLRRSEYPEWPALKEEIKAYALKRDWDLYGPELLPLDIAEKESAQLEEAKDIQTPVQLLKAYAKRQKVDPDTLAVGQTILKEVAGGNKA